MSHVEFGRSADFVWIFARLWHRVGLDCNPPVLLLRNFTHEYAVETSASRAVWEERRVQYPLKWGRYSKSHPLFIHILTGMLIK